MSQQGWYVHSFDAVEQWFAWTYGTSDTKHTAFGENEWLDGVRDYYTNRNAQNDAPFVEAYQKRAERLG